VGTIVSDAETGELLVVLLEHGQRSIIVQGGDGGFGNCTSEQYQSVATPEDARWPGEARKLSSSCVCSPMSACSACPTPASRR
jgi:GTP-binding protein